MREMKLLQRGGVLGPRHKNGCDFVHNLAASDLTFDAYVHSSYVCCVFTFQSEEFPMTVDM
jgi:hypothetical protein